MDDMAGGLRRTNGSPAVEPDACADDPADQLHSCCICGALLGFDPEDEIDGEGPGKDICGSCNATRNDEALMGG